jgi:hypothetical protein
MAVNLLICSLKAEGIIMELYGAEELRIYKDYIKRSKHFEFILYFLEMLDKIETTYGKKKIN